LKINVLMYTRLPVGYYLVLNTNTY